MQLAPLPEVAQRLYARDRIIAGVEKLRFFPLALESARVLGVEPRPFIIAITLAASFAFASPIGYQTHMMVYGPGGYRYGDFVRVGLPLNLLLWAAATILIPRIWAF